MGGDMAQIRLVGAPIIQSSDLPLSTGNTVGSGEDMMEHAIELIDHVPQTPRDSPLSGGHTPRSDEGCMTLKELTNLCTTLSHKNLGRRNISKHGRKNLKSQQKFQDINDLVDKEVIVEDKGSDEKGGSTAETVCTTRPDISAVRLEVSTAAPKTPRTTITLFNDEDVTIADTLVKTMSQKAKEKGIQADLDEEVRTERERQEEASKAALGELYDEVQGHIDADHELAVRLTHKEQEKYTVEERSKLLEEFFEKRKKQLTKERVKVIRSKPPTKTQLRNLMMTYLKNTGFEEDKKRVGSRKKRVAGLILKQKSPKKQKVNDQESVDSDKELRKCLKVLPDDDKVINYETLDVKSTILDCESQVLGTMDAGDVHVYKLTRLVGSYKHFSTFSRMLKVLDRQDVLDLYKIVMERFPANDLEGYDLILWGDLKTLMKSSEYDEI
nr:hypothetical protein [Tanacetum cinerariifolium]